MNDIQKAIDELRTDLSELVFNRFDREDFIDIYNEKMESLLEQVAKEQRNKDKEHVASHNIASRALDYQKLVTDNLTFNEN